MGLHLDHDGVAAIRVGDDGRRHREDAMTDGEGGEILEGEPSLEPLLVWRRPRKIGHALVRIEPELQRGSGEPSPRLTDDLPRELACTVAERDADHAREVRLREQLQVCGELARHRPLHVAVHAGRTWLNVLPQKHVSIIARLRRLPDEIELLVSEEAVRLLFDERSQALSIGGSDVTRAHRRLSRPGGAAEVERRLGRLHWGNRVDGLDAEAVPRVAFAVRFAGSLGRWRHPRISELDDLHDLDQIYDLAVAQEVVPPLGTHCRVGFTRPTVEDLLPVVDEVLLARRRVASLAWLALPPDALIAAIPVARVHVGVPPTE